MLARSFPIVFATLLASFWMPGDAVAVEALSCGVTPISSRGHLPSEVSIQLLTNQRLAAVSNNWIEMSYGQPVLANLKRKSEASIVLNWEVDHPGGLGGPEPATVHYRAVLNMRNLKITVLASEPGGSGTRQRGTGSCATADR